MIRVPTELYIITILISFMIFLLIELIVRFIFLLATIIASGADGFLIRGIIPWRVIFLHRAILRLILHFYRSALIGLT